MTCWCGPDGLQPPAGGSAKARGTGAALALSACLAVVRAACVIPFDGSLDTSAGLKPVVAEGASLVEGKAGQAVLVRAETRLAYPTAGVYDPVRGTVSLWVRPDWNAEAVTGDRLFWAVDNDPGQDNRISLGFWGNGPNSIVYFSNDNGVDAVTTPAPWKAGEWHHLLACWDQELRCRALYVDGQRRGVSAYGRDLPGTQTFFHVGCLPSAAGQPAFAAEAALDDLRLETTVTPADFAEAARALAETVRRQAERRGTQERLAQQFSLDRVARDHVDVGWEDLVGLEPPATKRVPIQAAGHPDVVFVQPDLSIALGREPEALCLGFAIGSPPVLPDMAQVTRRLRRGYLPVVESEWRAGDLVLTQTAFAVLPEADAVTQGSETQYVVVRLGIRNAGDAPVTDPVLVLLGRCGSSQNTNYEAFTAPVARWQGPLPGLTLDGRALRLGDRVLLVCQAPGSAAELVTAPELGANPDGLGRALRFGVTLKPGETRTLDLVVAGASCLVPAAELQALQELDAGAALARAEAQWNRLLAGGTTVVTPEPRLNDIYRALILSSLGNVSRNPDRGWDEPYQSPFLAMVWPWEFAHMAVPLTSLGFGREMRPALRYFIERQVGVGPQAEKRSPEGDVMSTRGVYVGSSMYWMCETGAVLWTLAEQYLYTRDAAWLTEVLPSALAACDWVRRERARTRLRDDDGTRVEYYGLLPKGRVHDWEGWRYQFGFTDTYTWLGLSRFAEALRQAGLPEAAQLAREADDYRECILEAARRAQFVDPDTGLLFVPNCVFHREGVRGGLWWADGPSAMFGTGLLPATDERFEATVEYTRRTWGLLMGLCGHMEPDPGHPFWYVNSAERGYLRNDLSRGEIEKALLLFYSTLVYGLSHDALQTCERIDLRQGNYAPFQPNASGNGRILEMLRRLIVDEQDPGVLWLLRGCPRRWFGEGQAIAVGDLPTLYGPLSLRTEARNGTVAVGLEAPGPGPIPEVRLVVRHPDHPAPARVTVNGIPIAVEGGAVALRGVHGQARVVYEYGDGGAAAPP